MSNDKYTYIEYMPEHLDLFSMGRVNMRFDDIQIEELQDYVFECYVNLHPEDVIVSSEQREALKTAFKHAE